MLFKYYLVLEPFKDVKFRHTNSGQSIHREEFNTTF